MENGVIEAYVTNLSKYNEGELIGEWVKFPVSKEEMSAVLNRIGIDTEYEETFITDYDTDLYGVTSQIGEYVNLDKLNYLAGVISELTESDRERYEAVLESGLSLGQDGLDGLINLVYNLDKYDMFPNVKDEIDLGRYYVELAYGEDVQKQLGDLANYIDFHSYGSDCQINEGGMFSDKGYVKDNGSTWDEYYDGSLEDIPDEYRLGDNTVRESEKITVLVLEPMKKPYVKEIVHTLENLQKEVGGSIEAVYPFEDKVAIICNDEHKFNGMPLNRSLRDQEGEIYDILGGNLLVVGLTGYDFGSLTTEQIEKFSEYFQTPEMFMMLNGNLMVLPVEDAEMVNDRKQEYDADATYSIYQLKQGEELREYSFSSMDELNRRGLSVNPGNYEKVYEASKTAEDTLESIYYRFNMEHPADFRGHSLSVSDVIVFHENGVDTAHYVDSYGFTVIPDFVTAKELTVGMDTTGLLVEGHDGTWHAIEELAVRGNTYYLLESETYGQDANMIVINHAGELIAEDITVAERVNARDIVERVLMAELEAMEFAVVPDASIEQSEMYAYGYEWRGMLPVREENAVRLQEAGLEIFALYQDNTESSLDDRAAIMAHGANGGIFGIEKDAWSNFLDKNPLAKVEELLEDDYGMVDGILNNGDKGKEVSQKKKSVREELENKKELVKAYDKHREKQVGRIANKEQER